MEFEKMQQIIADTLCCDAQKITLEARFAQDLGMDSLDAVQLNLAMEDAFGVSMPDEELANVKTVQEMYDYLNAHIA